MKILRALENAEFYCGDATDLLEEVKQGFRALGLLEGEEFRKRELDVDEKIRKVRSLTSVLDDCLYEIKQEKIKP